MDSPKKEKTLIVSIFLLAIITAAPLVNLAHSQQFGQIGSNSSNNDNANATTLNIQDIPAKKVHVGDIDIAYKTFGKGEPILLISGLGAGMNGWEPSTLEELSSSNHTVIVFDNRGVGNTTMGTKPFSIQQFADDTAGLMDGLKLQKADVLGYSMGLFVAQQLTLTHPEKVNRLILHGASCGGKEGVSPSPQVVELGKNFANSIANNVSLGQQELKSALSVALGPTWMKLHPDFLDTIPTNNRDTLLSGITPNAYVQQFDAVLDWYSSDWSGVCSQVPSISKPTLIITGTEDASVPAANSLIIAQKSPEHGLYRFMEPDTH